MPRVKYIMASILFIVGTNLLAQHPEFINYGCFEEKETPEALICTRRGSHEEAETIDYKVEVTAFKNTKSLLGLAKSIIRQRWKIEPSVRRMALEAGIGYFHVEKFCDHVSKYFFSDIDTTCEHGDSCWGRYFSSGNCTLSTFDDTLLAVSLDFRKDKDNFPRLISNIACQVFCESMCNWSCFFSDIGSINDNMLSKNDQKSVLRDVSKFVNKFLGTKNPDDQNSVVNTQEGALPLANRRFYITSAFNKKCIDVKDISTENRVPVHLWDCTGNKNQEVTLRPTDIPDVFTVVFSHSGKCLDVENAWDHDGVRLIQWDCNERVNQQFQFSRDKQKVPSDTYKFLVQTFSGKCLDVADWNEHNGATLQQWRCSTWENELFILHPIQN